MIELEYYCPQCEDFFIGEYDTNYRCKCGALLYLDCFDDEYAGTLGCCNTVENSYKHKIQEVFPMLHSHYISYLKKYCITKSKEDPTSVGYGTPIYGGCFETENEAWSACHLLFTKYNPSNIEEFDEIVKNIIFSGISGYFGLQK